MYECGSDDDRSFDAPILDVSYSYVHICICIVFTCKCMDSNPSLKSSYGHIAVTTACFFPFPRVPEQSLNSNSLLRNSFVFH